MRFDVLTLFPDIFSGYIGESLLKLAIERKLVDVRLHNIRDWAEGRHKHVDDRPFGGGPGMVLMPKPVVDCVEAVQAGRDAAGNAEREGLESGHLVMLSPQGRPLREDTVEELATHRRLLLLCGRYEGFDERIKQILRPDEISVGDFILNGGEVAAMVVIDACMRLIPGVLGDERSSVDDSFSSGNRMLEFPQYTRPREFRGLEVPEILLSGNHEAIAEWRKRQSYRRTKDRRADLLADETPQSGCEE